jgi:hypothetical protein
MISRDQLKYVLQIIKNNMTLRNYLIFFLISYCTITNIYLPHSAIILLNQPIVKTIALLAILYYSQKDMIISVLLIFALLLTINLKQTLDLSHMFNREQFKVADDNDDEESDNESDNESNDGSDDSGDESDEESDEELEKYTQNHPELRDGFTKLHNAIHDYENYMNK